MTCPNNKFLLLLICLALSLIIGCSSRPSGNILEQGMRITRSMEILGVEYNFESIEDLNEPLLTISGNDLVIDFQNATIKSKDNPKKPNAFKGLAIRIENGRNITLKNLNIHGFKVAILASNVEELTIEKADLSYNYRQKLKSSIDREDLSDWLSYHINEEDEWLRYGAAIYLRNCDRAIIRNVKVTGGQNGIMMTKSDGGQFYNNTIQFNSGVGIGLYRSNRNSIMHNKLDWNVRGYSHNRYARGQDSAGILCYEQSNNNIFAYNSATHSGDGFFLWAGQTTMDSGRGGSNDNILFRNDFSYAPTNGIELTFSRNKVIENRIVGCTYGIWAGYSYQSNFLENELRGNKYGLAIEHGNRNNIIRNIFKQNEIGLKLWERPRQPEDWEYAKVRSVQSEEYTLAANLFENHAIPLQISQTRKVTIQDNHFADYGQLLEEEDASLIDFRNNYLYRNIDNEEQTSFFEGNNVIENRNPPTPEKILERKTTIKPLTDGQLVGLPENQLRGRAFILVNEWGPYDFNYPLAWLREKTNDEYIFLLLGPPGQWTLTNQTGFQNINATRGNFPTTIVAKRKPNATALAIQFEYIGQPVKDQFGLTYPAGTVIPFTYNSDEVPLNWEVKFFDYRNDQNTITAEDRFQKRIKEQPDFQEKVPDLAYNWWQSPGGQVDPDHFITYATTSFEVKPGEYLLSLIADDGVRLYLDGKLLIDQWDIQASREADRNIFLSGNHTITIEHFEGGGMAVLNFDLIPL